MFVRRIRWRGNLVTCLTSDIIVRPVPSVLFIGWDHALILVEVGGEVHMYVCVRVNVSVRRVQSRGYLASYLTFDVIVRPVSPSLSVGWVYALLLVEVWEGVIYV